MTEADPLAPGDPPGEPIPGEAIRLDAVVPSAEANKADGKNRIGNTTVQVGLPSAIVTIGVYFTGFAHLDLDPLGPGRDMPTTVTAAFIFVVTVLVAYGMNRGKLRGEG